MVLQTYAALPAARGREGEGGKGGKGEGGQGAVRQQEGQEELINGIITAGVEGRRAQI